MAAGGHVAIQDIERISGVSRLEQWSGAGGTSLRLRTILDSGLVGAGAWAVIAPYTAQCEVRAISSYENRDLTVAALTYAHDPDTAIFVVDEPVLRAEWFTTLVAAINGTPDGFTLEIPTKAQTFTSWTTPTISSKSIVIRSEGNRKGILTGPNTTTDFINVGDAGNVRLENLYLKTWQSGLTMTNTGSKVDRVELVGVTFEGVLRSVYSANTSLGTERLVVEGCAFVSAATGANSRGVWWVASVDEALITGNRFETVRNRAIEIGESDRDSQDNWQKVIITGNHVKDVQGTVEAQGILVYGKYANVSHNTIETILSADGADQEGIYFKARHGIISNNILIDACGYDAGINVKGSVRGEPLGPDGWAVIVQGNQIYETRDITFTRGIWLVNDDVLCIGNYIEGPKIGIGVPHVPNRNISIINNHIIGTTKSGAYGIDADWQGERLIIRGNVIADLGDGSTGDPRAIRIVSDANTGDGDPGSFIWIEDNIIHDIGGLATVSNAAIYIVPANGNTNSKIRIRRNSFDDVYNAIVFGSSGVSEVIVSDNDFWTVSNDIFTNLTSVDGYDVRNNQGYTPPANGIDFTNLDETPSVKNKNAFYRFNYNAATNVTDFDDGVNGQRISIYFYSSNITLIHAGATINLHGNTNYNPPSDSWMEFICRNNAWYELGRSND